MSIYEKCTDKEQARNDLNKQMTAAWERMKLALDEADIYRNSLDVLPNLSKLRGLEARANDAYKEFKELGEKRHKAWDDWLDCLASS